MLTLQLGNCLSALDLQAGQTIYVPPSDAPLDPSYAPPEGCDDPKIRITSPVAGETITDGWEIVGIVDPPDFGFYRVQVRRDASGEFYETVFENDRRVAEGKRIGYLNFREDDSDGYYWVRLLAYNSNAQVTGRCAVRVYFDTN
jgi:hypothetical protein